MSTTAVPKKFDLPVSLRIKGKVDDVFASWVNREIAEQWLCDHLEGEWKSGSTLYWCFGVERQEIRVSRIETGKLIEFRWNANGTQPETIVKIEFRNLGEEVGLVLSESSFELSMESVRRAMDAACGWENLFCRLKAWTEAKVKLR